MRTQEIQIYCFMQTAGYLTEHGRLGFSVQDGENKYLESDYILFLDGDGLLETEKSIQESEGEDSLVFEGEKCRLYRIE